MKKARLAIELLTTDQGQSLVRAQLSNIERELTSLERRKRELEAERQQLQALVNGRKARTNGARNGERKRSRAVASDRVLSAIKELAKSGSGPSKAEVAEALGVRAVSRLTAPINELVNEGKLKRTGKARGTRYHLSK